MSKFHATIRDLLEDVHIFLTKSIQNEVLSSTSLTHKERLLSRMKSLQNEYPQLLLQLNENETKTDSKRCSASSPLPYVDMNGGSPYKIPFFPPNADKENYDVCVPTDRCDSLENHSTTGSEEYGSDDAKIPEVAASDLYSCEKCGYLDKKKRETLKVWLNPFQRRWCAIKDGVLYYFEKTTDRKQKGSILLAGYEARTLPEDNKEGKKYNNCFELVCPGKRTYQFSAASDNDLQQWISAVEKYSRLANSGGRLSMRDSQSFPTSPKTNEQIISPEITEDIYEVVDDETIEETPNNNQNTNPQPEPQQIAINDPNGQAIFNYSEWYVGLWDCTASDFSELSFNRGDLIHVLNKEFDTFSWWIGELNGKMGYVPKTYLMEAYESC